MELLDYLSGCTSLLHKDFSAYTADRLREVGLSFGFLYLILYIGKNPSCTQSQLREGLSMDWGYCQRSVEKLAGDQFIVREKGGRSWHLKLAPKGEEAFRLSHQLFEEWDREKLSALTDEERSLLLSLLRKLCSGGTMRFSQKIGPSTTAAL